MKQRTNDATEFEQHRKKYDSIDFGKLANGPTITHKGRQNSDNNKRCERKTELRYADTG